MKTTQHISSGTMKQYDKELVELLKRDLKRFRAERGKFLSNNQAANQDNDLLVA